MALLNRPVVTTLCAAALGALSGCATVAPGAYPYGGFVPPSYAAHPQQRYPLIVYLHGAGDTNPQEKMIPEYALAQTDFPFIVIAPRAARDWNVERLQLVLDDVNARYRIDPRRVYITGNSMGALGAWKMITAHPQTFAAAVLIAGAGNPDLACRASTVPVWFIHNVNDQIIPVRDSTTAAAALRACGGTVELSLDDKPVDSGWTHDAWTGVYAAPKMYDWLLTHQRR
jgi:predicted peptidase